MAKQDLTVELFYGGVWNAVPAYIRNPVSINRERPVGSEPTPFTATVTLEGFHNPKSPFSPLYGLAGQNTPIRFDLDTDVRFYGEVASWSPQRSTNYDAATGKGDAWTDVEATGILRRLGQGADPLRSPMFRSMVGVAEGDYVPHAYWPMEDGKESTQFASAVGGAPGIPVFFPGLDDPVLPANDDSMPGSEPVPTLPTNTYIEFTVAPYTDTGQVVHQVAMHLTDEFALGALIVYAEDLEIQAQIHPTGMFVQAAPISTGVPIFTNFALYDPSAVVDRGVSLIVASVDTGGGDTLIVRVLDDQGATIGQTLDINPGVYRRVDRVRIASFDTGAVGTGHYAMFLDPNFTAATDGIEGARAIGGWDGEQAHERVERLCREEGIPLTVEGIVSQAMGAQPLDTLTALFAEAERTDDGILFEPRDSYGLIYRCGRERYNRPVVLELDYATHDVAPPLRPVLDDLTSRNDVTVKRRGGSEAHAALETGPLSVQEPPDGIGRYKTTVNVNTATDDVLTDHAYWHLHKGTIDGVRYASVTVDLDARPGLVADAAAVDIGDVITIANLPEEDGVGLARLVVLGYKETIGSHRRVITYLCIPAATFDVGVYGTDPGGVVSRYGAADTSLAAAVDDDDASWLVDPGSGTWATTGTFPGAFPCDVDAGGLTYACGGITGAVEDTFSRSASGGWSAPDIGPLYVTSGGSASDYSVGSGVGRHLLASTATFRSSTLVVGSSDQDWTVDCMTTTGSAAGAALGQWICFRELDGSNHYIARLSLTTSATVILELLKRVAGSVSDIGGAVLTIATGHAGGEWYRVRVRAVGSTIQAAAYPAASAFPGWHFSATDTSIPTGTLLALRSRAETGNTNTSPTMQWDNLTMAAPLSFTVTRLPADKAHAAGTPITVTDTARYAL